MTDHDHALTETIERFEDIARGREKLGARDLLALAHALADTRRRLADTERLVQALASEPVDFFRDVLAAPHIDARLLVTDDPPRRVVTGMDLTVEDVARPTARESYDAAADRICSCKRSDALRMALLKAVDLAEGFYCQAYGGDCMDAEHRALFDDLRKVATP
jgi:hypothetical protein